LSKLYHGPIRRGRFGDFSGEPRAIWSCAHCGAAWLDAEHGRDYSSDHYRILVDGDANPATYYRLHDGEQAEKLRLVGTDQVRGKIVADFGAGGGSFLDLVSGMASTTLAIEPTRAFHEDLHGKGHIVSDLAVSSEWQGRVDLAVCFSVIEHVDDPIALLTGIRRALKPGGRALISTPNRHDWLLELLPNEYAKFFYREVHRWYFDAASLRHLGSAAAFSDIDLFHVHRFDMSNLLVWLRDRCPSGLGQIKVPSMLSSALTSTLEETGRSDYVYAWMRA
jgi:SAM-dependent methyltransferase